MADIKDSSLYPDYFQATKMKGISDDHRRVEIKTGNLLGDTYVLTEIGKIKSVEDKDGWLEVVNENDRVFSMKKIYSSWRRVRDTAEEYKEKEIRVVLRCGSGWKGDLYFNAIFPDTTVHRGSLLAIPDCEIRKTVVGHWIHERIMWHEQRLRDRLAHQVELSDLATTADRFKDQLEQLTRKEQNEIEYTKNWLKQNWGEFTSSDQRHIPLAGTGNNHPKRVFALRLGIDLQRKSRVKLQPLEHHSNLMGGNFVLAKLPEFGDIEARIGIIRRKTKKDYFITTVEPMVPNWHDHEPDGVKDADEPISWFMKKHEEIMNEIYPPIEITMATGLTMNVSGVEVVMAD